MIVEVIVDVIVVVVVVGDVNGDDRDRYASDSEISTPRLDAGIDGLTRRAPRKEEANERPRLEPSLLSRPRPSRVAELNAPAPRRATGRSASVDLRS